MSTTSVTGTVVPESAAQRLVSSATRRTHIRIGALRAQLRLIQDKQDCRINRVHTAYLLDRLGVENRHLERLRAEAERLYGAEVQR